MYNTVNVTYLIHYNECNTVDVRYRYGPKNYVRSECRPMEFKKPVFRGVCGK